MKRMIALIVAALLLTSSASAQAQLDALLYEYNVYASVFGATEIDPGSADIRSSGDSWRANFSAQDDKITLCFMFEGQRPKGIICACSDEAVTADYLSACCAVLACMYGRENIIGLLGPLLFDFTLARQGEETSVSYASDGGIFQMRYENDQYMLVAVTSAYAKKATP